MSVLRITCRPAPALQAGQSGRFGGSIPVALRTSVRALRPGTPLLQALRRPAVCAARSESDGAGGGAGFSHGLFLATIDLHKRVNVHPALAALRGSNAASGRVFGRMLVDKLAFHTALEELLPQHRHEALLAPFFAPVLPRTQRLRNDLKALAALPHVRMPAHPRPSQAAVDYVEALRATALHDPRALAAHAWLHYLGDMHGGQMLQASLVERHGVNAVQSLGFAEPVQRLREIYGACLDVPLSPYEQHLLHQEAREVYKHSLRMYDAWLDA